MLTQKQMINHFMPQLVEKGATFTKFTAIDVRKAIPGEKVVTITGDGKETENTANDNDYVVRNHTAAQELYIISDAKLRSRYKKLDTGEKDGWEVWQAVGDCVAIEHTGETIYFVAPWGEEMVVKPGDMLVTLPPKMDEVYRIARKEFFETYMAKKNDQ